MTEEIIIKLGQEALKTTAMLATPMLASTLIIGLVVSIFQALTQINEATLTFVPKMIIIALILVLAGPWMLDVMTSYTINLYENISMIVRE
jgi:flagellar biosynthesis protein FliQ